jgi:hypothetical protein
MDPGVASARPGGPIEAKGGQVASARPSGRLDSQNTGI